MYYQTYMRQYYLEHKEKIKKQAKKWREKNPGRLKVIQSRYRIKRGLDRDFREEKIEVMPFEKRVSQGTLDRMKENSRINKKLIKYYEWSEDLFSYI